MREQQLIAIQCKDCGMMEIGIGECAIWATDTGENYLVFNCPDCDNNSQTYKIPQNQVDFWQSKGVVLFQLPTKEVVGSRATEATLIKVRCVGCNTSVKVMAEDCRMQNNTLGQLCLFFSCPNCAFDGERVIEGKKEYIQLLKNSGVVVQKPIMPPFTEEEIDNFVAKLEKTDTLSEVAEKEN